ncbi:MAG: class I SAM-dependent methyltransferase [Planctomycetota bacterium]|nr:class I SAM-dependent methyltransferase [Planctomycetota bacterium]
MTEGRGPDLERLRRLRDLFLDATGAPRAVAAYWQSDEDLAAYDAVFAARIGWKWDAALEDAIARGFAPGNGLHVVDFGCGTGIAARRFAARFDVSEVRCVDHSARAAAFAAARLRDEHPQVATSAAMPGPHDADPDVLLISHVLDELGPSTEDALLELAARSKHVVWVEPGSRVVSRRLATHRDHLVANAGFSIVAPCPHQGPCSALRADGSHWCHFFASPPAEVFTDGDWVRLGRELGIDLRALPYASLVLSRAPSGDLASVGRVLARPEVSGKEARVFVCDAEGLHHLAAFKSRGSADAWRTLKKAGSGLRDVRVERDGAKLRAIEPLHASDQPQS